MSHKTFLIAGLILLVGFNLAHGQAGSEATDKGSRLISGGFSFSSQGGDLYGGSDDRLTIVSIVPSLFYFVAPGIGLGADLAFTRMSSGDDSMTSWGVGPKIGFFKDSGGDAIPYISGGVNYLSIGDGDDSENGLRFKFGGGVLIRKGHLAMAIEVGYIFDRYKFDGDDESTTGNTIVVGIGFGGFLY